MSETGPGAELDGGGNAVGDARLGAELIGQFEAMSRSCEQTIIFSRQFNGWSISCSKLIGVKG